MTHSSFESDCDVGIFADFCPRCTRPLLDSYLLSVAAVCGLQLCAAAVAMLHGHKATPRQNITKRKEAKERERGRSQLKNEGADHLNIARGGPEVAPRSNPANFPSYIAL